MKTWHKFVAVAVVVATAYGWQHHRERGEVDALRGSVQSLTQAVEDTHRDVERTAARVTLARRPPPDPAAPVAPAAELPEPVAGEPARPPLDAPTLRAHLDTRFERQVNDSGWSGAARASLEHQLAGLMPPRSTLKSVECKETMCRIEMVYSDLAQYQAFMQQLTPAALPWNGTLFSSAVGDPSAGPATIVAFLSREGEQLAVD